MPYERAIAHRRRSARSTPEWEIVRKALARPVFAVLGDYVFEAGMAAIAAVAMIAVQPHHRCGRFEQILRLDERHRGGKPRIGLGVVMGHPVTAAEQEIVAGEALPVEQRHD
jgi:hypothetical protein